jgi:membrane-associated phospholipid phosphatase
MSRALSRAPIAAAAACAAGFGGVLVFSYGIDRAAHLDASLFEGLGSLGTPGRLPLFDVAAYSADPLPLIAFLAVLATLGLRWGRRAHVIAALATVGAAAVTTQLLKIVLAHPRVQPILGGGISPVSFPSGHATAAMSMAVALVLVVPRRLRTAAVIGGAGYALAVSVAVIVLGWHYPSDVLAGLLVATGFGFLAVAALRASGHLAAEAPVPVVRRPAWPALETGLALAGVVVALLAITRADDLLDYARSHTGAMFVAFGLAGLCAALLAALSAAAEE